jgi:pyruvate/2-oxoglutarate dehydrogenase complex dihydrolipoamide acyltransferase (E2) component
MNNSKLNSEILEALKVPRDIANSDSVFLVKWHHETGDFVNAGSSLCDIETSKTILTVSNTISGYLFQLTTLREEVAVGGILGEILSLPILNKEKKIDAYKDEVNMGEISSKAQKKIKDLGLNISEFVGKGIIREKDVIDFYNSTLVKNELKTDLRGDYQTLLLDPIQLRVSRAMTKSHLTIPSGYLQSGFSSKKINYH